MATKDQMAYGWKRMNAKANLAEDEPREKVWE